MNQITTKSFWLLLVITITAFASCKKAQVDLDCNEIIISPVADQQLYENTRTYIPLSVAINQLDKIKYSIINAPSFIKHRTTQRGRAELTLDPTTENIGLHNITIEATDGQKKGCLTFSIEVEPMDKSIRVIHCNPRQKMGGSGISEDPYGSLSQLLSTGFIIEPHDLIVLHTGNHGSVTLSGSNYQVVSVNESIALFTNLSVTSASDISIKGIEVRPEMTTGLHNKYLVYIDSASHNVTLSNNKVISTRNSEKWTVKDWNQSAARGIKCLGNDVVIQSNLVQNVFHGIKTEGENIEVSYNHVDRFGGDAIRNIGSNNSFTYNFLTNATVDDYYDKGGNHDDLFQSWTYDLPVDNIRLSHNTMISCLDTLMPLRAKIVQGLVCFDGFETNWVVNNNLVITDHPHGIALYGAENCAIHDNTVLKNPNNLYDFESDPWIMVNNHKDGRISKSNKVKNNITSALAIVSKNVEVSGNIVIDSTKRQELKNYYDWDFRFKK